MRWLTSSKRASCALCRRLFEDLLDVVGRPYDGVDHIALDDVHETVLDPGKGDHPLVAVGIVAHHRAM
jgi:hypothetical protein